MVRKAFVSRVDTSHEDGLNREGCWGEHRVPGVLSSGLRLTDRHDPARFTRFSDDAPGVYRLERPLSGISVATLTANAAYQGWRGRRGELTGSRRNRAPHSHPTDYNVKQPISGVLPS